MPTIASHQDLAAAAEPLLQQSGNGSATDARPDGEVGPVHICTLLQAAVSWPVSGDVHQCSTVYISLSDKMLLASNSRQSAAKARRLKQDARNQ